MICTISVLFQLLCSMEKLHLIKTPFWRKRTNLSENHKSKKYQAANSSTTYIGQNVDPLHDISVSDTNETLVIICLAPTQHLASQLTIHHKCPLSLKTTIEIHWTL